jgi:hypothetical protein
LLTAALKAWSAGSLRLRDVTAEGKSDPVGSALLRYALSGLGGKQFWAWRAAGFKVFTSADSMLTKMTGPDSRCYLRCSPDAAALVDWGFKIQALLRQCDRMYARGLQPLIIGRMDNWDGVSTPKQATFMGLVGLQARATMQSVKDALTTLHKVRTFVSLRCCVSQPTKRIYRCESCCDAVHRLM